MPLGFKQKVNVRGHRINVSVSWSILGKSLLGVTYINLYLWTPGRNKVRITMKWFWIVGGNLFTEQGKTIYMVEKVMTFLKVAKELSAFNLGYQHVMDGLGFGCHDLGEPMTLAESRSVYKGLILGNCGYTKEDVEERVKNGDADLVALGRSFISNPDLVERLENGWPLEPCEDMAYWYTPDARGYTDYKPFER